MVTGETSCLSGLVAGGANAPRVLEWLSVKNLRTQETLVQSLGREDPLEEMAAHSSILAWEIPWTGELGGLQSMGLQRDMTERLDTQVL